MKGWTAILIVMGCGLIAQALAQTLSSSDSSVRCIKVGAASNAAWFSPDGSFGKAMGKLEPGWVCLYPDGLHDLKLKFTPKEPKWKTN